MKNIAHIYTEPASYTMDLIENIDKKLGVIYYFLKNIPGIITRKNQSKK